MATRFTLTHRRHIPGVLRATQDVWQVLGASDGLVGYTLRADVISSTLSTLTVWRDPRAMYAFVRGAAHASVVDSTRHRMAASTFASWSALGAALPPTWSAADRALDEEASRRRAS